LIKLTSLEELEDNLSAPNDSVVKTLSDLGGDVLVLGAGGKMGPSLSRMALRAIRQAGSDQRVFAVSRFSGKAAQQLEEWGIETISGDLLDPDFISALPDALNVIYMAGKKFGTAGAEHLTWATNAYLPALVCGRFRHSRIVAFSTGNVYPQMPIEGPGATERDLPNPIGEYGMSCLGRERMFEYFSRKYQIHSAIIRLNYATELRYGALVDLAEKVFRQEEISLTVGGFNVIWQADANAITLCSLMKTDVPPFVVNVTGPVLLNTKDVAMKLGSLMGKDVRFVGEESPTALHSSVELASSFYNEPLVEFDEMLIATSDWIMNGRESLGKPTHFEVADGQY
jgi:nucleoside-diphosphate-sugar epimerase